MAEPNIIHRDRGNPRPHAAGIPLRFNYSRNGIACLGSGRVSDLSRGGVRFHSDSPPPSGTEVELRLAWPFHLQMASPPELVIRGAVLRTGSWGTVVRMHHYAFRACGEQPFNQSAARAEPRSITV
jgi:hypothetical protein